VDHPEWQDWPISTGEQTAIWRSEQRRELRTKGQSCEASCAVAPSLKEEITAG
jgi:hypothetical protein